jgi:hypothetical protein
VTRKADRDRIDQLERENSQLLARVQQAHERLDLLMRIVLQATNALAMQRIPDDTPAGRWVKRWITETRARLEPYLPAERDPEVLP